jgi:DNA polymerase (family X)
MTACAWITRDIAQVFGEIADLLEIKGENPFKIRAYRNGRRHVADTADRVAELDEPTSCALPGIGKDLAAAFASCRDRGTCATTRSCSPSSRRRSSTCCGCRASGRRPWPCSTANWHPHARRARAEAARAGRLRGLKGMGAKKEQLILKALESARRRGPPPARRYRRPRRARGCTCGARPDGGVRARSAACGAAARRAATSTSSPSAAPVADGRFVSLPLASSACSGTATRSRACCSRGLSGRSAARPPDSRGAAHAVLHRLEGPQHRLRDRAFARGCAQRVRALPVDDETRVAGETEEGSTRRSACRGCRRSCARSRRDRGGRGGHAAALVEPLADLRGDCTCTPPRPTAATTSRRWRRGRGRWATSTSPSPTTARRWRWPTASTSAARWRTPRASARSARASTASRVLAGIECDILPTAAWTSPTTAWPSSTSSSRRCTRPSARTRRR